MVGAFGAVRALAIEAVVLPWTVAGCFVAAASGRLQSHPWVTDLVLDMSVGPGFRVHFLQ